MKWIHSTSLICLIVPLNLYSAQSYYCAKHNAYIKVGMSESQVIAACGKPLSKQESTLPVLQKVKVTQLVYNNRGTDTAFYGVWNIPTGSGGAQLEVTIVNNKVREIKMGDGANNAFSICGGVNIQVGDPLTKVYNACGNPSIVNSTFINQSLISEEVPVIWVYQPGPYQPSISLTFVEGKLQFINQ